MIDIGKRDMIWSYASTILSASISVMLMPFVLAFLGDSELGLWYVYASISALVLLLDFGFAPTVARNIAFAWSGAREVRRSEVVEIGDEAQGIDWELFESILATCRLMYLMISFVAALLMSTLGTWYVYAVASDMLSETWLLSWALYAAGVFLNLLYGYLNAFLRGVGAVAEISKSQVFARIAQLGLSVILLLAGLGIIGCSLSYLVSGIILRVTGLRYFLSYKGIGKRLQKGFATVARERASELFKIMWSNAWRDGLVSVSVYLCTQANTLICSYVLGLVSTGSYGLSLQVANIIGNISAVWYSTNQPRMQECVVTGNRGLNVRLFGESIIVFVAVGTTLSIGAIVVGVPLIRVLRPSSSMDPWLLAALCAYTLAYRGANLCASCISNFNTIPYYLAFVLSGICSVTFSAGLAAWSGLGIWSLVVAPTLVLISYNIWKWPRVALEMLGSTALGCLEAGVEGMRSRLRRNG